MQIVLEIPKQLDLDWLLKLFQQLNLRVVQKIEPALQAEASEHAAPPKPEPQEALAVHSEAWMAAIKPMRKHQSIEDMIAEQNYKGMDLERMDERIERLDIQEPIETLLAQLAP